jgi:hypothetical protein
MSEDIATSLSGPAAVAVSVTLGVRGRAKPIAVDVALANIGDEPVTIERISCDPVQLAASGVAADAFITPAWRGPNGSGSRILPPGETIILALTVDAPRRAGTYASTLRFGTAPSSALNIPIGLQVGVNPVWGISAMLAGLMLLAVVYVLAGEADLRDELHKILQFRQDATERLEQNPPPESQSDNLAAFDADVRQAVQAVTMPRQWSVVDHRIDEAREQKRAAEDELKEIEDTVTKSPAGAAQVAELDREWARLRQKMTELKARNDLMPGQNSGNFAGHVAALVADIDKNLVALPAQIDLVELDTHVELVDLALRAYPQII